MGQQVRVNIQKIEPIGRGRIRVKILETKANLSGVTYKGRDYIVSNNLGRGRYIMKYDGPKTGGIK